jgi:CRISPR-associated protein Cas1
MHDQDTGETSSAPRHCGACGSSLEKLPPSRRFCSTTCYQQWWTAHRQRDISQKGTARLIELLTTSGGDEIRRRIADSNRQRIRRPRRVNGALSTDAAVAQQQTFVDAGLDADEDDVVWAQRGDYWGHQAAFSQSEGEHWGERGPLILTGHGVHFRVEQGTLIIRNGFTHYPQRREEWRFFPGDRARPSRIVVLDADGSISFHVAAWLARHAIPIVLLDWQGQVTSVMNGGGRATDAALVYEQLSAQHDGRGLWLSIGLIKAKIEASLETLKLLPMSPLREQCIARVQRSLHELTVLPPPNIEALRLAEGRAALAYFTCWQIITLHWKGLGRKPIPPEWHHAGLRQSFISGTNRHATHPVNAMLNYAYGVLESQLRIATVAAGLDPAIGYLHASRPARAALVYDLMEPLRPQVDRRVLNFVQGHTFDARDLVVTERGVCRLHPQLARTIAGLSMDDRVMHEVVDRAVANLGPSKH